MVKMVVQVVELEEVEHQDLVVQAILHQQPQLKEQVEVIVVDQVMLLHQVVEVVEHSQVVVMVELLVLEMVEQEQQQEFQEAM